MEGWCRVNVPVEFSGNAQMAIHVPDLDRANAFYQGVLGLELLSESETQLAFDAGEFTLYVNRDDQVVSFVPSFEVDDLEATREMLEKEGVEIEREHGAGFYFMDPFGFVIDVVARE
jgi:catechol 2,3-dioxygenase-like lactoylglutathione lyase family enzyme